MQKNAQGAELVPVGAHHRGRPKVMTGIHHFYRTKSTDTSDAPWKPLNVKTTSTQDPKATNEVRTHPPSTRPTRHNLFTSSCVPFGEFPTL